MAEWLLEAVMAWLRSPEYTTPVMNFIDEKCIVFDAEEEFRLEFTAIHNEFVALVFGWVLTPEPAQETTTMRGASQPSDPTPSGHTT